MAAQWPSGSPELGGAARGGTMSLGSVVDELYALPPQDFVRTRNDLARTARAAGDDALAGRIRALRKPTAVAWLANQVVRRNPDMIDALSALGHELRAAMAVPVGAELRRLNERQRELVHDLVQAARELAAASGHPVTEQVVQGLTDTLRAALADPQAAEALAAGRLTTALEPPAFGGMAQGGEPGAASSATAGPARGGTAPNADGAEDHVGAVRLEEARQAASAAQADADEARFVLEQAEATLAAASTRNGRAAEDVERLSAQLADAQEDRAAAEQAQAEALAAQARAALAAGEAQERLGEALKVLGRSSRG